MKRTTILIKLTGIALGLFLLAPLLLRSPAPPLGVRLAQAQAPVTKFTFQGRLTGQTGYVQATCAFEFRLYDASTGGTQLGPTLSRTGVTLTDGYFTVDLDFGSVLFAGSPRYLEVSQVNCGRAGDPVALAGRIELNPAPSARRVLTATTAAAVDWANITNKPAGFADDTDDGLYVTCTDGRTLAWVGGVSGAWSCSTALLYHNQLGGRLDDDHPQYLLANGARPMSGDLNLNSHRLVNLALATANGQVTAAEQTIKTGDTATGDLSGSYPGPTASGLQGQAIASTAPISNQVLTFGSSGWAPAANQAGGPAGGDLSGTYPNPTVARLRGRDIATTAPASNQALRWNSTTSKWEPADVVNYGTAAGGDLSGTYPSPTVARLWNRTISNVDPLDGQVLTWNASAVGGGRWEPADPQVIGTAGGDLSGTYPNPTVVKIRNQSVASTAPAKDNVLVWTGSQWTPGPISTLQTYDVAALPAPTLNQVLTWNGTAWVPALVGTLQGRPVLNVDPATGQVLQWNGSQWAPGTVIKPGDAAGGDLTGTFPNPTLAEGVVGPAELVVPMAFFTGTATLYDDTTTDVWIMPASGSASSFTATATGQCLVFASAFLEAASGHSASSDPNPSLQTARWVGTATSGRTNDASQPMYFSPDDTTDIKPDGVSANHVWEIVAGDVGQQIRFGCYIRDSKDDADWDSDITVTCRVSYVCM